MFLYQDKENGDWRVEGDDGTPFGVSEVFESKAAAVAFMRKQTMKPLKTIRRQYQDAAGRMHTILHSATAEHTDGFDANGNYTNRRPK